MTFREMRRALRLALTRRAVERDFDDELRYHLDMQTRQNIAGGLTPGSARRLAEHELGGVDRVKGELASVHRGTRGTVMDAFGTDVRYAIRGLRRTPWFSAAAILTLALGIGANATMFGIIDRLLLRPPAHVLRPDEIYKLQLVRDGGGGEPNYQTSQSYATYTDVRDHARHLTSVSATTGAQWMSVGRGADARRLIANRVTGGYFGTLGVQPQLGRFFAPGEDRDGAGGAPVVVISHDLWQREYGGRSNALGRTLDIGRRQYTIVGVAPEGFSGIRDTPVDLWVLYSATAVARGAAADWATSHDFFYMTVLARLAPGATLARAEGDATAILRSADPDMVRSDSTARLSLASILPRNARERPPEARIATLLGGVSLLVLLIACANIANLLLARALRRRREIALRLALGVSRARLGAQLLTESLVLAALGGAAAILVVRWGGSVIAALLLDRPASGAGGVDARVVAVTVALALVTGILTGLVPAIQASTADLTRALREGARDGSVQRSRTRTALVLVQAALSVVLLVGTGLFVRSLRNINAVELGIDTRNVLAATMDLESMGYTPAQVDAVFRQMAERFATTPGIAHVSVAGILPFASSYAERIAVPGLDPLPRVKDGGPYLNSVGADFFATLGTRIVRGRPITAADEQRHARVIVVNETMASLYWPGQDPIGRCVKVGGRDAPCSEVIGVSENTHRQAILDADQILHYYVPLELGPEFMKSRVLFVRPQGDDARQMIEPVRRMMQSFAPNLPYANVRVMQTLLGSEVRPWQLGATMFGIFGGLALLLAAIGLYSVVAYGVTQRTHEMGVRVALGARANDVLRLVVVEGLRIVLAGAVAGLIIAAAAGPAVTTLLYHVSPRDPAVFGIVLGTLVLVAVLATIIPAWRASRVDPVIALRAD
jgi:putative ABC transport system permease protein